MKRWFLGVLVCGAFASAQSQVITGEIASEKRYKDWNSFLLSDGKRLEARAITHALDANIPMALDLSLPGCLPVLSFLVPSDRPHARDNTRSDVVISFRVDRGQRFDLPGFSQVTMGDHTGMVFLERTGVFDELVSEMKRGFSLRVKLGFGGDESTSIYLTYSLSGFTAALTRAEDLCSRPSRSLDPLGSPPYSGDRL